MTKKILCAFAPTSTPSQAGSAPTAARQPLDIQRGIFATEVGVPRLLRLFKKYGLKTPSSSPATPSKPSPRKWR